MCEGWYRIMMCFSQRAFGLPRACVCCKDPWDKEKCEISLSVNALYEASGHALWLAHGVFGIKGTKTVDPGDVNWKSLQDFVSDFFDKKVTRETAVKRKEKKVKRERLLWPAEMVCMVDQSKVAAAGSGDFDASLQLAGGHFILWSWYLALFHAIQAQDLPLQSTGQVVTSIRSLVLSDILDQVARQSELRDPRTSCGCSFYGKRAA